MKINFQLRNCQRPKNSQLLNSQLLNSQPEQATRLLPLWELWP
jgi:hypothetical protein